MNNLIRYQKESVCVYEEENYSIRTSISSMFSL